MKTTFSYDHYFAYDELKANLEYFAEKYPGLVSLDVNCVTPEGRNQYAITVTNKKTGEPLSKPGFSVDGNTHAGEITGSMAAMHMIDYLITNYGSDPEVTRLLDAMTVYSVPRISPDGTEAYLTSPYSIRSVDRLHGNKDGGVREEDIDGDGVIRMMRFKTPYGAWKLDPSKPGSMAAREPGDADGEFYDVYPEGIFEEYEGDENLKTRDEKWGYDFNRNFPCGWFPENRQHGAGEYPLCHVETKALADWVIAHPNIGGVSTGHTSGGMILYPPGTRPIAKACPEDIRAFRAIADMGKRELGYEVLNLYEEFVSDPEHYDSGAFDDWCYQSQGILAYTIEYWDMANKVGVPYNYKDKKLFTETAAESILRFNACVEWVKKNAPEAWHEWKEYDHPYLGKVEIGGFDYKFTHQNPPGHLLKDVLEPSTRFLIRFAASMPRLRIDCAAAEKIADGLYKVCAVVGNTGYLPTYVSEESKKLGIAKPVTVRLEGAETVSGKAFAEIGDLQGFGSTETGVHFYGNISTARNAAARKKLEWIVKAPEGTEITVTACSQKAGTACAKLTLK
jgi:hypothetical protein